MKLYELCCDYCSDYICPLGLFATRKVAEEHITKAREIISLECAEEDVSFSICIREVGKIEHLSDIDYEEAKR